MCNALGRQVHVVDRFDLVVVVVVVVVGGGSVVGVVGVIACSGRLCRTARSISCVVVFVVWFWCRSLRHTHQPRQVFHGVAGLKNVLVGLQN